GRATDFALREGPRALRQDGEVSFHAPMSPPWLDSLHRTRTGRWLRVEILGGQYSTPPEIGALSVDFGWELPRLGRITAAIPQTAPAAAPSPAAFCNASPLDLSKDFYPLGQQPRFHDTVYVP